MFKQLPLENFRWFPQIFQRDQQPILAQKPSQKRKINRFLTMSLHQKPLQPVPHRANPATVLKRAPTPNVDECRPFQWLECHTRANLWPDHHHHLTSYSEITLSDRRGNVQELLGPSWTTQHQLLPSGFKRRSAPGGHSGREGLRRRVYLLEHPMQKTNLRSVMEVLIRLVKLWVGVIAPRGKPSLKVGMVLWWNLKKKLNERSTFECYTELCDF